MCLQGAHWRIGSKHSKFLFHSVNPKNEKILENSYKYFLEISVFRSVAKTDFWEAHLYKFHEYLALKIVLDEFSRNRYAHAPEICQ